MLTSGTKASHNVIKVPKAPLLACLTCTLCSNLFVDATTISECLHTFCEDCIHERLGEDEENCCPICNVLLGCLPLEKLRVDNQLRDLIEKIFPRKRNLSDSSGVSAPNKRKERYLSSLGVQAVSLSSSPNSSTQKGKPTTGKSFKTSASDKSEGGQEVISQTWDPDESGPAYDTKPVRFEAASSDFQRSAGVKADGRSCSKEPHMNDVAVQVSADEAEPERRRSKTLANAAACVSSSTGGFLVKRESPENLEDANIECAENRRRTTMFGQKLSLRATKNLRRVNSQLNTTLTNNSLSQDARKGHHATMNKGLQARNFGSRTAVSLGKSSEVWFTLRAANNQAADGVLPQISTPYIRIRDGRLPVSFVKKYLARKLDLRSETEIEITCRGQPVVSSLPLESVQNIWLATAGSAAASYAEETDMQECYNAASSALDTASARNVLMVLTYGRNKRSNLSH